MTLRELEHRLADWHRMRYGGSPVDMAATTDKLTEEMRELADELECVARGESEEDRHLSIEAADVFFVLVHLCRGAGQSLADAVAYKLDVIERRLTDPGVGR